MADLAVTGPTRYLASPLPLTHSPPPGNIYTLLLLIFVELKFRDFREKTLPRKIATRNLMPFRKTLI